MLRPRDVHVWRAAFGIHGLELLEQSLDDEERRTAGRFRFDADRLRYVHAHGVLRAILARYLGASPRELAFTRGPHGKPELATGGLHFSLSRSSGLVLCAIGRRAGLGVDVERERARVMDELTEWVLPAPARRALRALPEARRARAFLRGWTRLEACLKARGRGLSAGVRAMESLLTGDLPSTLIVPDGAGRRWWVRDLSLGPGFVGALATHHPVARFTCRAWPPAGQQLPPERTTPSRRARARRAAPALTQTPGEL